MRRMLTSRQIEILDSMTEEVFESGVWDIADGTSGGSFGLKNLEVGYQYKIYLNASVSGYENILRFETEIGLSEDYHNFIEGGQNIQFVLGSLEGATELMMRVYKNFDDMLTNDLIFSGTTTEDIYFRYLITRHKLYI